MQKINKSLVDEFSKLAKAASFSPWVVQHHNTDAHHLDNFIAICKDKANADFIGFCSTYRDDILNALERTERLDTAQKEILHTCQYTDEELADELSLLIVAHPVEYSMVWMTRYICRIAQALRRNAQSNELASDLEQRLRRFNESIS